MKSPEEYANLAEKYCNSARDHSILHSRGCNFDTAEIRVKQAQVFAQLALVAVAVRMEEKNV